MAKGRGSASTGFAVALVMLSIFFVAALVVAVFLLAEGSELKDARRKADNTLANYVSPDQQKDDQVLIRLDKVGSVNKTVIGQLIDEKSGLVGMINGSSDDTPESIRAQLEQIGVPPGRSLLLALKDAKANQASAQTLAGTGSDSLKVLRAKVLAIEDALKAKSQEYARQVSALEKQLATENIQRIEFNGQVKERFDEYGTFLVTAQQDLAQARSSGQIEIDQKKKEKAAVLSQLNRRPKVSKGSFDSMPASRHADANVVKVDTNDKLVYIDRGRRDRMVLGLAFVVFDKQKGVTPKRNGDFDAKAIIEVVSIDENSSTCRIVDINRRGLKISSGDLVANAVWDPKTSLKFYVHGEFDIDRVGKTQEQDRKRIASICRKFGGSVAVHRVANQEETTQLRHDELSKLLVAASKNLEDGNYAQTLNLLEKRMKGIKGSSSQGIFVTLAPDIDFLVLGQEPVVGPKPQINDPARKHDNYRLAKIAYETYKALEAEARELAIPILHQNRFLQLVGYYRR
jgi:hypothetical protein